MMFQQLFNEDVAIIQCNNITADVNNELDIFIGRLMDCMINLSPGR